MIIASMLPICSLCFRFTGSLPFTYSEISDEICISQLREIMLISYDLEYGYDTLEFTYCNKTFTLSQVNDHLILQPGTQIMIDEIDDVHFEIRNGCIYACYEKKGKEYERIICKSEGIHLDRFSDCHVCDDESDSGEE